MNTHQKVWARHVGYTPDKTPLVSRLGTDLCKNLETGFGDHPNPMGRQLGYVPDGSPLLSSSWDCCDAISDTYVEADCFPFGDGPGITNVVYFYITNVQNCSQFGQQRIRATYSAGAWSIALFGLTFTWACNPDEPDPTSPNKFPLTLSGCVDPPQVFNDTIICEEPLWVDYGNIVVPDCCSCPTATTDTAATINVQVRANCKHVAMARHVGWIGDTPIVARDKPCSPWDTFVNMSCEQISCQIFAEITDNSGCPDMASSTTMCFNTSQWVVPGASVPPCSVFGVGTGSVNFATVTCVNNGNGTSTFTFSINCGATNSGTGSATISNDDLEALDVTIEVAMTDFDPDDPGSCCAGSIHVRLTR